MAGEIQLNSVTLATESGGVASIDSSVDIKGPLNASGSAPLYVCRAWVNFNGTGTVAIRASGNVSSITDNGGSGDYTVNFTTAMPNANYSVVASCSYRSGNYNSVHIHTTAAGTIQAPTTSAFRMQLSNVTLGSGDSEYISAAVFI